MLDCAIGIPLYRRLDDARRLFEALERNHYCEQFPIYVSIDYSDRAEQLMSIVDEVHRRGILKIVDVVIQRRKLGCGDNHIALVEWIKEDDFIILEDDVHPLAVDCLNYVYSQFPRMKTEGLFSTTGYRLRGCCDNVYGTETLNAFIPFCFGMTRSKWMDVVLPALAKGWHGASWDYAIQSRIAHQWTITPRLARVQNVGETEGTHVPSAEWHRHHCRVDLGAWNVGLMRQPLGDWGQS